MKNKRHKTILKGILSQYYECIDKCIDINNQINALRIKYGSPKSVSFNSESGSGSGKTNDEKLVEYCMKLDKLNADEISYHNKAQKIYKKYHLGEMPIKNFAVANAVFHSKNYQVAGKKQGYSSIQIYRIMDSVYDFMDQFL